MTHARPDGREPDVPRRLRERSAPATAAPLTDRRAWLLYAVIGALALSAALAIDPPAIWPTSAPAFTIVALSVAVAIANKFGTMRTIGSLAEISSLSGPITFATFLLLDWRESVIAAALGEFLTFLADAARRENPTMWYLRVFNVFTQVAASAIAGGIIAVGHPGELAHDSAVDVRTAIVFAVASIAWKTLDSFQSLLLVTLEAGLPVSEARVPARTFLTEFSIFVIAIPFARLWYENVWLSIFALAPLAVSYRLLRLPEMERRLNIDERTGLTNATSFDRALSAELVEARERGRPAALLAIDIDNFKLVNDTYGHPAGDVVIARFAGILSASMRPVDVAARIGGDEFAILLKGGDRATALVLAERIRTRVEREVFQAKGEAELRVTASIGVAIFPGDGSTPGDLLASADGAMYVAKRNGRNRIREVAAREAQRLSG